MWNKNKVKSKFVIPINMNLLYRYNMNYEYGKVNLLDWSLRLCYNQVIDVKSGLHKISYSQSSPEKKIVN